MLILASVFPWHDLMPPGQTELIFGFRSACMCLAVLFGSRIPMHHLKSFDVEFITNCDESFNIMTVRTFMISITLRRYDLLITLYQSTREDNARSHTYLYSLQATKLLLIRAYNSSDSTFQAPTIIINQLHNRTSFTPLRHRPASQTRLMFSRPRPMHHSDASPL